MGWWAPLTSSQLSRQRFSLCPFCAVTHWDFPEWHQFTSAIYLQQILAVLLPFFSMYIVRCLFFFCFYMKEAAFSIMVLQIQDVIQEHSEVQRAEQVLPFSKLDSEQHRLDKIHSNTVTRVETLWPQKAPDPWSRTQVTSRNHLLLEGRRCWLFWKLPDSFSFGNIPRLFSGYTGLAPSEVQGPDHHGCGT